MNTFAHALAQGRYTYYFVALALIILFDALLAGLTIWGRRSLASERGAALRLESGRKRLADWGIDPAQVALADINELEHSWDRLGASELTGIIIGIGVAAVLGIPLALISLAQASRFLAFALTLLWGFVAPLMGAYLGVSVSMLVGYARVEVDPAREQPPRAMRAYFPPRAFWLPMISLGLILALSMLVEISAVAKYSLGSGWVSAWLADAWPLLIFTLTLIALTATNWLGVLWLLRQPLRRLSHDATLNRCADYGLRRSFITYVFVLSGFLLLTTVTYQGLLATAFLQASYAAMQIGFLFIVILFSALVAYSILFLPTMLYVVNSHKPGSAAIFSIWPFHWLWRLLLAPGMPPRPTYIPSDARTVEEVAP